MVGLSVCAFAQLSRFPDTKRGARFRVYFERKQSKAERRRHAMIAIGQTVADGSVYSHIGDLTTADIPTVVEWLDANVPAWLGWAKGIFKFFIQ